MGGEEEGMKAEDQWTTVRTDRETPATSDLRSVSERSDKALWQEQGQPGASESMSGQFAVVIVTMTTMAFVCSVYLREI